MIGERVVVLEEFEFNGKVYEKGHQFTITGNDDIRGLDLEDDYGNSIGETRFSGWKFELISKLRDGEKLTKEEKKELKKISGINIK